MFKRGKVDVIIKMSSIVLNDWKNHHVYNAPENIPFLFDASFFDKIILFTNHLRIWNEKEELTVDEIISAYVNLGTLVESWLIFFLSIDHNNYKNEDKYINSGIEDENELQLLKFFKKEIKQKSNDNDRREINALIEEIMRDDSESQYKLSYNDLKNFAVKNNVLNNDILNCWIEDIHKKCHSDNHLVTREMYDHDIEFYYDFIERINSLLPPLMDEIY